MRAASILPYYCTYICSKPGNKLLKSQDFYHKYHIICLAAIHVEFFAIMERKVTFQKGKMSYFQFLLCFSFFIIVASKCAHS